MVGLFRQIMLLISLENSINLVEKNQEIARILKFLDVSVLLCLSFFSVWLFSVKVHSVPKSKRTALQAVGRSSFEK